METSERSPQERIEALEALVIEMTGEISGLAQAVYVLAAEQDPLRRLVEFGAKSEEHVGILLGQAITDAQLDLVVQGRARIVSLVNAALLRRVAPPSVMEKLAPRR